MQHLTRRLSNFKLFPTSHASDSDNIWIRINGRQMRNQRMTAWKKGLHLPRKVSSSRPLAINAYTAYTKLSAANFETVLRGRKSGSGDDSLS